MVLDNDNLSIIITNDHKLTLSEVLPYVDRALQVFIDESSSRSRRKALQFARKSISTLAVKYSAKRLAFSGCSVA